MFSIFGISGGYGIIVAIIMGGFVFYAISDFLKIYNRKKNAMEKAEK